MSSKEYEMAIKIAGDIEKSFYESTKLTKKELAAIAKEASVASLSTSKAFSKGLKDAEPAFNAIENAGKAAFKAVAAGAAAAATAVGAVTVASVNVGSEFESAFAGVRKTVEATETEYAQMEKDIREMATSMPTTPSELSEIAEAAGQLGIAKENIAEFSKTMADMEVATNMTSEDSATDFARFANITGMSQEKFSNLGSSVVALGNNLATTESEIVEMAMRLAGAGAQVNMSEAQIMGVSAALSSVGIEAEAGGYAFSKLMVNMQLAVETGNKSLSKYAKVAGMTAEEFKTAFKDDAATAITSFVSGLNDTERNGMSAIAVLDDMGISEVRMRDALLRAAGASDMFNKSMQISNEAWEKNTALANEAEQRYKTFESQVQITKNNLTDMGISAYQNMRGSLTEGLYAVNNELFADMREKFFDSGMLESITGNLKKQIPTIVRETKELGQGISEFAEPFLAVGGWLVDNPGLLVGTITGVGSALSVYKVANGIMSMTSALSALGPVGIGILALGGVAGVIVGIGTAVKKSADEAKKANLAEHFGDIALSLSDLNEVADFIIYTDNLGKVREALEQFEGLDTVQKSINDSMKAINKMNWKVSIGMELSETEIDDYKGNIENYVQQCQQYVTDQQYAMTMAVGVLTDDDLEGQNIVNQLNQFYADKQGELAQLGTDLNNAITDAFQDGLLDIDEAARISEIQSQMAEVQAQLAGGNFEASLEVLSAKYGGNLDAESFQNLQAELAESVEEAKAAYEEPYHRLVSQYWEMLQEGKISQEEYDLQVEERGKNYLKRLEEIDMASINFQLNTIMNQYSDELATAEPEIQKMIENMIASNDVDGTGHEWVLLKDMIESSSAVSKDTQNALSELYKQMEPSLQMLDETANQYMKMYGAIPKEILEAKNNAAFIGMLGGNSDSTYKYVGGELENNEAYQQYKDTALKHYETMPEEVNEAIKENQSVMQEEIKNFYKETDEMIKAQFENGFDISADVRLKLSPVSNGYTAGVRNNMSNAIFGNTLYPHAKGGIFDTPHYGVFAEKGMEAFIPIDGSQNAIDLWQQTGELLGMKYRNTGDSISALSRQINSSSYTTDNSSNIEYKPQINFYGDAPSRDDIDSAMITAQERFNELMKQYIKDHGRFSLK